MRMVEERSATWAAGLRRLATASIRSLASGMGRLPVTNRVVSSLGVLWLLPESACQPRPIVDTVHCLPVSPACLDRVRFSGGTMLTIFGKPHRNGGFCDGVIAPRLPHHRRHAARRRPGAAATCSRAEAQSGIQHVAQGRSSTSSCPAARRTWTCGTSSRTPRPRSAASSSRSRPTSPASRSASSSRSMAKMMDKFVVIRSLVGSSGDHDAYQCMTGRKRDAAERPATGRRWARGCRSCRARSTRPCPPHLSLMYHTGERRWGDPGDGGFLGMAHAPFRLVGGKGNEHEVRQHDAQGRHARAAQRPRRPAARSFDDLDRSIDQQRRRWTAWTPSTSRRSAS